MKKELPAIAIGIGIYYTLYYLSNAYGNLLITKGIIEINGNPPTWNYHPLLFVSTILTTLIYTIPFYAAGWLSKKSGTVNGLIVAVISTFIQSTIFETNWEIVFFSFTLVFHSIWFWIEGSILTITVGTLCGAAGELHREKSKKNL